MERDDQNLLEAFVKERSEAAFAEMVRRHLNLVYSASLRQLGGDAHAASDAAQRVFCELANKAPTLLGTRSLAGWLYNTARYVSARARRTEFRRSERERAYSMQMIQETQNPAPWKEVEAVLDEAMGDLGEADRQAVVLRYFRDESLAEVGRCLGASENAARMRVERALEKLRLALERRGVRCPSAALGTLLLTNAIGVAPTALGTAIIGAGCAAVAGGAPTVAPIVMNFMTAAKLKTAIAVVAVVGLSTAYLNARAKNKKLEGEVARLRSEAVKEPLVSERPKPLVDEAELERLRAAQSELMKLRGEVTRLRAAQRQPTANPAMAGKAATAAQAAPHDPAEREEAMKRLTAAKMMVARSWGVAFYKFAGTNNGIFPTEFHQAAMHYRDMLGGAPDEGVTENDFEIVYRGSVGDILNPAEAIIMRDREPFDYKEDGTARRTYLFADGHTEIVTAKDGSFEAWEEQRQARRKPKMEISTLGQ